MFAIGDARARKVKIRLANLRLARFTLLMHFLSRKLLRWKLVCCISLTILSGRGAQAGRARGPATPPTARRRARTCSASPRGCSGTSTRRRMRSPHSAPRSPPRPRASGNYKCAYWRRIQKRSCLPCCVCKQTYGPLSASPSLATKCRLLRVDDDTFIDVAQKADEYQLTNFQKRCLRHSQLHIAVHNCVF